MCAVRPHHLLQRKDVGRPWAFSVVNCCSRVSHQVEEPSLVWLCGQTELQERLAIYRRHTWRWTPLLCSFWVVVKNPSREDSPWRLRILREAVCVPMRGAQQTGGKGWQWLSECLDSGRRVHVDILCHVRYCSLGLSPDSCVQEPGLQQSSARSPRWD